MNWLRPAKGALSDSPPCGPSKTLNILTSIESRVGGQWASDAVARFADRRWVLARAGAYTRNSPSISDIRRINMSGSRAENGRKPNFA